MDKFLLVKKVRGTQKGEWIQNQMNETILFSEPKRVVCIIVEMLYQVSYVFEAKGTVNGLINWFNISGHLKSLTEEVI